MSDGKATQSERTVFWMTAKHNGRCAECTGEIFEDDRMVWDRENKKAYCAECGEELAGADPKLKRV